MKSLLKHTALLLFAVTLSLCEVSYANESKWYIGWYNSLHASWESDFILPTKLPQLNSGDVITQTAVTRLSGESIKLNLSNKYGEKPLRLSSIFVSSDNPNEAPIDIGPVIVPAGEKVTTKEIALNVERNSKITISFELGQFPKNKTFHWDPREWTIIETRNGIKKVDVRLFLESVKVKRNERPLTIVAVGDSITDGNMSSMGENTRWTDFLNRRFKDGQVILNAGISGNRLLSDGMGRAVVDRIDDIIKLSGVDFVVLMIGTNDIGWPQSSFKPNSPLVDLEKLKQGLIQVVDRLKNEGIDVVVSTLPPFKGALENSIIKNYYSPKKQQLRDGYNSFIRQLDGVKVVDVDLALRDTTDPEIFKEEFDSGDHLHPNDDGYQQIARQFDVSWFVDQLKKGGPGRKNETSGRHTSLEGLDNPAINT